MKVYIEFRHNCREIASSSWSAVETCGEGSGLRRKKRPPPEQRPQLVRLFISGAQLEIWTTHRMEPAMWKKGLACPAEDGGGCNNTRKVANKQLIVLRPAQGDLEKKMTTNG